MQKRKLGQNLEVPAMGLGCMGLSLGYGNNVTASRRADGPAQPPAGDSSLNASPSATGRGDVGGF